MREYKTVPPSVPQLFLIQNKYSYIVNLNHPLVVHEWQRFKKERCIIQAASDAERLDFEMRIIKSYPEDYWDWWMNKAQYMICENSREKGELLLELAARCLNEQKNNNAN